MISRSIPKLLLTAAAALLLAIPIAALAAGKMRSERINHNLCETTGGGRFVGIPGFPGERIDRRLKRDVKLLVRKYKLLVTDGYSLDPVHSKEGEHPRGLALDIVPDTSRGGRWRDVGRLARWAEPKQNQPRAPFRWVGYNGDANHGRGHHLHLSWAHSETRYNKPARTVYTLRCPGKRKGGGGGKTDPPKGGGGTTAPDQPQAKEPTKPKNGGRKTGSGGVSPAKGYNRASGGIQARKVKRKIRRQQRSAITSGSRESGGVGAR